MPLGAKDEVWAEFAVGEECADTLHDIAKVYVETPALNDNFIALKLGASRCEF